MIKLTVKFCLILNPYICQTLEMVPADHATVSIPECMRGGAVGGMTFVLDNMEWQTKGWYCTETPNVMQSWLKDRNLEGD